MGDPLVKLSDGRVMTLSQYQAMVNQAVSGYTQQITVAIEQLSSLQDQMYVHSGDVSGTLSTLQSDLSGIDAAIGTDDQGKKFHDAWNKAWPQLQQAITGVSTALGNIGDGLGHAADTVYSAEQQTLASFNNMGFKFNAVDPRVQPAVPTGRGRMRAF
jgi:uncharacterized protein YukE